MDDKFATAEKKVLVDVVKLVQRQGMKGLHGDWKQFLSHFDKKFGASLSDPSRRSNDVLVSFLKSFTKEEDVKLLGKVLQSHLNRNVVEQVTKESLYDGSPEQRLVRLTLEHPLYALDYAFPSHNEGWVVTKLAKKSKVTSMVAVDCEMVHCQDGTEALVRVCVVDHNLQVKLDKLVNPNKKVADYRTEITGVTARDLDGVTFSLRDIQQSMKKLLSPGTILVGHSLNNDLQALKIDHAKVIDTALIFQYSDRPVYRRPSLNTLCKASFQKNSVLGYEVRKKGAPHNCMDDASAAMKLVHARIERGIDTPVSLVQEAVPESEMAKLLIHNIPLNVPNEDLYSLIPGDFTIELKPSTKAQGDKYSAFAIFKDPQQAKQAFENVEGTIEKDSSGRPQKLLVFKLNTGVSAILYLRKMTHDCPVG
ncbi:RNase_T domain-containing protein [Cephalotus follicularis]|uniref:RNase_T domain-containing protein n=1 Tax=Cephalotus follicularis TaxID=3775 RepID=A0A1Q3B7U3_CEPFO|nr:RNase_T domain-containing protein [Cephalotus follicularis]